MADDYGGTAVPSTDVRSDPLVRAILADERELRVVDLGAADGVNLRARHTPLCAFVKAAPTGPVDRSPTGTRACVDLRRPPARSHRLAGFCSVLCARRRCGDRGHIATVAALFDAR